jgi:hypothetical protein
MERDGDAPTPVPLGYCEMSRGRDHTRYPFLIPRLSVLSPTHLSLRQHGNPPSPPTPQGSFRFWCVSGFLLSAIGRRTKEKAHLPLNCHMGFTEPVASSPYGLHTLPRVCPSCGAAYPSKTIAGCSPGKGKLYRPNSP